MHRVSRVTERDRYEPFTYAHQSDFYYEDCFVDNRTGRWYDLRPVRELPSQHSRGRSNSRKPSEVQALVRVTPQSGVMSGAANTRSRVRYGRKEMDCPAIGSAMFNLHAQLEAAEEFYNNFVSGFDSDTGQLSYLPRERLDEIWTSRVAGVNQREGDENGGEAPKSYTKDFVEIARKVDYAIQYALQATVREAGETSESAARRFKAERFQDKITLASTHIHDLAMVASKARAHCQDLVEELQSLKQLIDPEKNKAFYKHDRPYEDEKEECEL